MKSVALSFYKYNPYRGFKRSSKLCALCAFLLLFVVQLVSAQNFTKLPDFPGLARDDAFAELIGGHIYYGTGYSVSFQPLNDLWRYSLVKKSWAQLSDAAFSPRQYVASAAVGSHIFIFGGWSSNQDFHDGVWRYDTEKDGWQQMSDFPGEARWAASAVAWEDKIYFGLGRDTLQRFSDWWHYDPENDQWTRLPDLPAAGRNVALAEAVNDQVWVGLGEAAGGNPQRDLWIFDIRSNSWLSTGRQNLPALKHPATAVLQNKIYLAGGENADSLTTDFIELDPTKTAVTNYRDIGFRQGRGGSMVADCCKLYLIGGLSPDFERLNEFGVVDVDPYGSEGVDFYPNPASGLLSVRHPESAEKVQVFDPRGQLVMEVEAECARTGFSVSGLRVGLYFIRWCGEGCSEAEVLEVVK